MERLNARNAWIALGIGIVAWELSCREGELLSEGVDRALEAHPLLTRAAIGITAVHLANGFDAAGLSRYDPFKIAIERFKPFKSVDNFV